jgi:hypothetical protein
MMGQFWPAAEGQFRERRRPACMVESARIELAATLAPSRSSFTAELSYEPVAARSGRRADAYLPVSSANHTGGHSESAVLSGRCP